MKDDVLKELLASRDVAAQAAHEAREAHAAGSLDQAQLTRLLTRYILAKYRLDENEYEDLRLDHLAEASIAKMLKAPAHEARSLDGATCDGADSAHVKQALLMMAIQKDFNCKLDGFKVAFCTSVDDLAMLVFAAMEEGCVPQCP